jgi:heme A synthase
MTSPSTAEDTRAIWAAIITLVAVLIGATTGLLSAAGGVPVPLAIIAGGGAFATTAGLLLAVVHFFTAPKK